jgi:hypothetical protein
MKKCKICLETKSLSDFQVNSKTKDGHLGICKECHQEKVKKVFEGRQKQEEKYQEVEKKFGDIQTKQYLISSARKRAKEFGIECSITPGDLEITHVCPIMLQPMSRFKDKMNNYSYTLDRIDSTKGYVKGNVRVISWRANWLKGNLTLDQAERLVKYMRGEL